jgi:hypothetical protein
MASAYPMDVQVAAPVTVADRKPHGRKALGVQGVARQQQGI